MRRIQAEYEEACPEHVINVSRSYVGYDAQFYTQQLNPALFMWCSDAVGYLQPQQRTELFGKDGFLNTGFRVQGELPFYGAWNEAKSLTDDERCRYSARARSEQEVNSILADKVKIRRGPYAFESLDIQKRSFAEVWKLMDGALGEELSYDELDVNHFVTPFFGIGQRLLADGTWKKAASPIVEHLTLPGIPEIIDGILYTMNPSYEDTRTQLKADVVASVLEGRKAKAKGKMSWQDVKTIPTAHPDYDGFGYSPCIGKIDLFRAYNQFAVKDPRENQMQIWDPFEDRMRY
eukprot:g17739.t1